MILLQYYWPLELLGRLHPLMVHFPIGLLVGALLLEFWSRLRNQATSYAGMVYLGAACAVLAALMGGLLESSGDYEGQLVEQHQVAGYLTAGLSVLTALGYFYRQNLPVQVPFVALLVSCLGLSLAGHLGASITHGEDYLASALPWNQRQPVEPELVRAFQSLAAADSFPQDQLDRLGLEVRATFAHSCNHCHSSAKRKGGLSLDHEKGLQAGGDNGPVLVAGNATESEMIRRLNLPRDHEDAMPPEGKILPGEEIELISLWIDQGAYWTGESKEIFREAPLALHQPDLPAAPERFSHPIDRFVNAYFEEQDVSWPEPINDRRFIRRAFLDVIGLLPSPEVVQKFVDDKAPDKRTRMIQQLLDDNQNYVAHWLSYWNDLLRNDYSGTGFITGGRKQVTEWLYRSLSEDKPYNQMVSQLIDPTPESEGFIKGIQWRGVVNASQRTELQAAQNISQSLLGVNLKCASCHNSFVNNLTLDQAYGFANIFSRSPLEIYRCDKPTGRTASVAFLYPELGQVESDSLKDRLRELSDLMVQPANGRLYRTVVNGYWGRLMGRGIVSPVDEMDNRPWSQELLDWLAADFIKSGYDLKHLLKRIMTSRTYQLPPVAYPSPEYINSEVFVFEGPTVRSLSAEQFADAFAQVMVPMYYGVAYEPSGLDMEANWIWHKEMELDRRVVPKPGTRFFRKKISLERSHELASAEILVTADQSFRMYLNGEAVAEGADWRQMQSVSLPGERFNRENIIAVSGYNGGAIANPAGLLFAMRLRYGDGSNQIIYSDESWVTTADTLVKNWTDLAYDDSHWEAAWNDGRFENSYWGAPLDFRFDPDSVVRPFARASLVRVDDFMKTLGRPVRENVTTQRDDESTLLKSLMLTNSSFFHQHITEGAMVWLEKNGQDSSQLVERLYLQALGREPTEKEKGLLMKQLDTDLRQEALEDVVWTILMLPEFQLI